MLNRFKTSRPTVCIVLALWIILEVVSIPAAAQVAMRLGPTLEHEVFVSEIQSSRPGIATYMVTHSGPLNVSIEGVVGEVSMLVQKTKPQPQNPERRCVLLASGGPQVVFAGQPARIGQLETRIFTLSYNAASAPAVQFKENISAPVASACRNA